MVKNGNNMIVSIITGSNVKFTELFLRWTSGKSKRINTLHGWYLQVEFRRIACFVGVWKNRAPCSRTGSPKVQDASQPHSNSLCVPHCYLIIFHLYYISSCPLFSTSLKIFITDNSAFHRRNAEKKNFYFCQNNPVLVCEFKSSNTTSETWQKVFTRKLVLSSSSSLWPSSCLYDMHVVCLLLFRPI